nr:PREDICTED: cholecystokinin receptor type A-like isoform X2 [Megachile rotundata]
MSFSDHNISDKALKHEYGVQSDMDQLFVSNIPQLSTMTSVTVNITLSNITQSGQADLLETLIIPLYGTIFLLSIIGNSLVLITLARNKRMRTVTNVYLLNLAVSDLLLGVFCIPFTLLGQVLKNFVFGVTMCKLIPYFQAVSVSVGVWTLVAISLERYFAICRPLKSRRWQTQFHAYKMIAVVWTASLTWNAPILVFSQLQDIRGVDRTESTGTVRNSTYDKDDSGTTVVVNSCGASSRLRRGFSSSHGYFHGASQGISSKGRVPRTRIARDPGGNCQGSEFSHESGQQVRSNGSNCLSRNTEDNSVREKQNSTCPFSRQHVIRSNYMGKSIEAKKKVIRMLFVIVLEFFICWAPLHVINTWYLFAPQLVYSIVGSTGISLVQLLAYVSSCCNPITYCFMNRKFRQAFLSLFDCHRCWRVGCRNSDVATASTKNAAQGGNNSELSGNETTVYLGKASLVARSEVVRLLEEEDRV